MSKNLKIILLLHMHKMIFPLAGHLNTGAHKMFQMQIDFFPQDVKLDNTLALLLQTNLVEFMCPVAVKHSFDISYF